MHLFNFLEAGREYFMESLASMFGFESAMVIKNLIIFASGAAFAYLLATLIGTHILKRVKRDERVEGAVLVRVPSNNKKGYVLYANPKSPIDYLHTYFAYVAWTLRGRRCQVQFSDEKIGRILVYTTVGMCVVLCILGLWFALQVYPSKPLI